MNSPRMQRFGRILLVVFALACVLMTVACAEGEEVQSKFFGTPWSLLPPVVAIVLALITKEVHEGSLLVPVHRHRGRFPAAGQLRCGAYH